MKRLTKTRINIPSGRTKKVRRKKAVKRWWQIWLIRLGLTVLAFSLALTIGLFITFWYYARDLPPISEFSEIQNAESTKIYDSSGKILLYELYGEENRTIIPLKEMSDDLIKATLAVEDSDFYKHPGVHPKGIIRAAWVNLKGEVNSQGGSTITQQLIKNTMLTDERTYRRKIKEVILALELERKYSKDEILEAYINRIPYGSNAYGIQAASKIYFDKDATDLSLGEAAILAALPNQPSYLSPYGSHKDELQARQEHVLIRMSELGWISDEEKEEAIKEGERYNIIETKKYKKFVANIEAPHFVFYVRDELEEWAREQGYAPGSIETMGLKVTTTLDWELQEKAAEIVTQYSQKNIPYNISNMALTAVRPDTGHIISMVGSLDYWDEENDGNVNVTIRERQPGSSFKPYSYAAAFEKGYTPKTILYDVKTNFGADGSGNDYIPKNYDGTFSGAITMDKALARSLNIPAIKTYYLAGEEEVVTFANKLGLGIDTTGDYGLSTAIGSKEVKLINHVGAYGVFANDGVKVPKTSILKIEKSNGKLELDNTDNEQKKRGQKVMKTNSARLLNSVLSNNDIRTFGKTELIVPGYQAAAKTGTSNQFLSTGESRPTDVLTLGYTPTVAAGVWAGNNDSSPLRTDATCLEGAALAWQAFMVEAVQKFSKVDFSAPSEPLTDKSVLIGQKDNGKTVELCQYEALLATEDTPNSQRITRTYGSGPHSILFYVDRDDPTGEKPKDPSKDPQYNGWESAVQAWTGGAGIYGSASPPEEYCTVHEGKGHPNIEIQSPGESQIIIAEPYEITVSATSPLNESHSDIKIARVEFYIDNKKIGTVSTQADDVYKLEYDLSSYSGETELVVKAFDSIDNMSQSSLTFTVEESEE